MNLWHLRTKAMIKIITGINHDKFNKCLSVAIGIGAACSKCYAKTADYGFKSCKEHVSSNGATPGAFRRALVLVLSSAPDDQALELMFVGQAALEAALEALEALALMLSRTLGLISLALELVLSSAQTARSSARRRSSWRSRRSRRWRSCSAA